MGFGPMIYSEVFAQSVGNLQPDAVGGLTSNTQTLGARLQHWYQFDYSGGNQPIRVTLDVTPAGNAGFQVWTVEQVIQLANNVDVAPFATGTPDASNPGHIAWEGSAADPTSFFVVVQSNVDADSQYVFNVAGLNVATPPNNAVIITAVPNVALNLRTGPGTTYPVIRALPAGTSMTVLGRDASSTWLSVQLSDGAVGWVAQFLTTFVGTAPTIATLPLVQPPLAPPPTVPLQPALNVATDVNIRTGPSTAYPTIRTVVPGTQMSVLGQDATGAWLFVQFGDGVQGWIARFLTNFTDSAPVVATPPLAQPPLAPPATLPVQIEQATPLQNGIWNVNIRSGPGTGYAVLRTVTSGTQMTILGQDTTGTWLFVQFGDGGQGWIARFLTNFTGTVPALTTGILVQPPLAPPATISPIQPSVAALPGQTSDVNNLPVERALGSNWRTIRPGQLQWFTFDHPGDETEVQIWLDAEPSEGVGFRVMKEGDAQSIMAGTSPEDIQDIGRGTFNENEAGDLFWRGGFTEHGRFYVMIENGGTRDVQYSIFGAGPSIGGIAAVQ